PGMFGTAQIRLSTTQTAVFAPATAVLKIANADAIYVIEGNRAQFRIVQLGEAQGEMIRIDAGLEAGAAVATNNLDKLADGAAVRLIDVSGTATATAGSR